jgi:hypothetical protein
METGPEGILEVDSIEAWLGPIQSADSFIHPEDTTYDAQQMTNTNFSKKCISFGLRKDYADCI